MDRPEESLPDLLRRVADRVDEVVGAEERVRTLLDAVLSLGGELDLQATFERLVEAAARLAGARYAALGVVDRTGVGLSHFVTFGITAEERAAIGHEPRGQGILGRLIRDPRPLRLADLHDHPESVGFPPHHPPMTSFLGVPVLTGDRVLGNLYLTEKHGGGVFTAEDEASVVALAAAAGVAVENARLYEQTERGRRSSAATAEILRSLLSRVDQEATLALLASRAREVSGADLAFLLLEDAEDRLIVVAASGAAEEMLHSEVPREGALVDVVERGATLRQAEGIEISSVSDMSASLLVPFTGPSGAAGALVVAVRATRGAVWPADEDVEAMRGFADQAALALERAQARQDRAALDVLADRDRIARDLHDLVIQRLFATGLSLQGLARRVDPKMREQLEAAVAELDATIKDIRGAIFELHHGPDLQDLRGQLREVVRAASQSSELEPRLEIDGPVESAVPDEARPHLVAVLVEALSNAVRHAGATSITAHVAIVGDRVELTVADDGRGFVRSGPHSGLRNMRSRAESLGGGCVVDSVAGEGTTVRWWAPIAPPEAAAAR